MFKNLLNRKKVRELTKNELYALALEEVNSEDKDAGLYARSFAEADGDADMAKAIYMKHRVDDISAGFTAMANEQLKQDWLDSRAKRKEEKAKEKELAYRAKVAGAKYIKK